MGNGCQCGRPSGTELNIYGLLSKAMNRIVDPLVEVLCDIPGPTGFLHILGSQKCQKLLRNHILLRNPRDLSEKSYLDLLHAYQRRFNVSSLCLSSLHPDLLISKRQSSDVCNFTFLLKLAPYFRNHNIPASYHTQTRRLHNFGHLSLLRLLLL